MIKINDNYLKLPGSYLFSTIAKKVSAYQAEHPEAEIIRMGIGDVTLPLAPQILRPSTRLWTRWGIRRPSRAMPRT